MKCVYHSCKGASHEKSKKPCQDASYAEASDMLSIAIVSDGHGGERYFRSDRGSQFLVDITKEAVRKFVNDIGNSTFSTSGKPCIFDNTPFTEYSSERTGDSEKNPVHSALRWLFSSIISQWNDRIEEDAMSGDITKEEQEIVDSKYLIEFENKRLDPNRTEGFEKTYGCTLMAYVQTPKYWFAFQIGDGICVSLNKESRNSIYWTKPIPWDSKCFLNKTTSICDSSALEEFRYCYEGDGKFPTAVFLGSDGMDDTFGDGEKLANFYMKIYKELAASGKEKVHEMFVLDLPELSRRGSKDDISIACVYDDRFVTKNSNRLSTNQLKMVEEEIKNIRHQINALELKIAALSAISSPNDSEKIDLDYAIKQKTRKSQQIEELVDKCGSLKPQSSRSYSKNQHSNDKKKNGKGGLLHALRKSSK